MCAVQVYRCLQSLRCLCPNRRRRLLSLMTFASFCETLAPVLFGVPPTRPPRRARRRPKRARMQAPTLTLRRATAALARAPASRVPSMAARVPIAWTKPRYIRRKTRACHTLRPVQRIGRGMTKTNASVFVASSVPGMGPVSGVQRWMALVPSAVMD